MPAGLDVSRNLFRGGEILTNLLGMAPNTSGFVRTLVGAAVFWSIFLPATVTGLRWFR